MPARRLRAALIVAATAAACLLAASPAAAEPGPITSQSLVGAPCATATLDDVRRDSASKWFIAFGSAVQCGTPVPKSGFRVVTYRPDERAGIAYGFNARRFSTRTPFAEHPFGAAAVPGVTGDYGVCVVAGENNRLACLAVSVVVDPSRPATVTARPIKTSDRLVARDIVVEPYTGSVNPPVNTPEGPSRGCGTCF